MKWGMDKTGAGVPSANRITLLRDTDKVVIAIYISLGKCGKYSFTICRQMMK